MSTNTPLSWLDGLAKGYAEVADESAALPQRARVRFLGAVVTVEDNEAEESTDVTIDPSSVVVESNTWEPVAAVATANVNLGAALASADGVTLSTDDRVGLVLQDAREENGIYVKLANGHLERAEDATASNMFLTGKTFTAKGGASYSGRTFGFASASPIALDSDPLDFVIDGAEIDPHLLGALGNGVADDTAPLDAAMTAAAAVGATVKLRRGTYLRSTPYAVLSGVALVGEGSGATVIKTSDAESDGITVSSATDVAIRNLSVNGASGGTCRRGVRVLGSRRVRLEGLEVVGALGGLTDDGNGIELRSVIGVDVVGCYVHGNGNATSPTTGGPRGAEILISYVTAFLSTATGAASATIDGTRTRLAQRVVLAEALHIRGFGAKLATDAALACSVRLETDSSGSPSGTLVDSDLTGTLDFDGTTFTTGDFTDDVLVAAGTYWLVFTRTAGSGTFDGAASGTADQVKTYNGAWGLDATIDNAHAMLSGTPNTDVRIDGCRIDGTDDGTDFAVLAFDVDGLTATGNFVDQGNTLGAAADADSSGYGIGVYDADGHVRRVALVGNHIQNCAGSGIYYQGSGSTTAIGSPAPNAVIASNTLISTALQQDDTSLLTAAIATNAPRVSIVGNSIADVGLTAACISFQGAGTVVQGNTMSGAAGRAAVYVRVASGDQDARGSIVASNRISGCLHGVVNNDAALVGVRVVGNSMDDFTGATSVGIGLSQPKWCDLSHNHIRSAGHEAIIVVHASGTATGNAIDGNQIADSSQGSSHTYSGISNEGHHTSISGNRSTGSSQNKGIVDTGHYNRLIGNDVQGNNSTGITYDATSFAWATIQDESGLPLNQIQNLDSDALALRSADGTTDHVHIGGTVISAQQNGAELEVRATGSSQIATLRGTTTRLKSAGAIEFVNGSNVRGMVVDFSTGAIGVFNKASSPATLPAAYTQTFATAARTMPAYTPDDESAGYTGQDNAQPGSVYAKYVDLEALRVAYENLRAIVEANAKLTNSVIDDFQGYGWLQ